MLRPTFISHIYFRDVALLINKRTQIASQEHEQQRTGNRFLITDMFFLSLYALTKHFRVLVHPNLRLL